MEPDGKLSGVDLDAVATVRPLPEVVEAMRPWLGALHAHPDSAHRAGALARKAMEEARADVAALVGALPEEVVFTSGGTEATNLAIHGVVASALGRGAARLAVPAHDPPSIVNPARSVSRGGAVLDLLDAGTDGTVDPGGLGDAPLTLLAFAHAHPELGALAPAERLVELAHGLGATVLVDLALTLGRIPADRAALGGPEMLALSFHRMGGPMGVGAWIVDRALPALPLLAGGPQENGRRPGSPNLAGVVGAAVAARIAMGEIRDRRDRLLRLGAVLADALRVLPGVRLAVPEARHRLPGHVAIVVPGLDGEALVTALDDRGLRTGTGSSCVETAGVPSASLLAAGFPPEDARATLVLCIPPIRLPHESEVEVAAGVVAQEVARLLRVAGRVAPESP